jgi:hypothetical protein
MSNDLDSILDSAPFAIQAWRLAPWPLADQPALQAVRVWPAPGHAVYSWAWSSWMSWGDLPVPLAAADPGYDGGDRPELLDGWSIPMSELFGHIPAAVRDVVEPMPREFHWRLLCLLDSVPAAAEVLVDNPALAIKLAWLTRWTPIEPVVGPREVSAALREPRHRGALRLLGLPERRAVVRLLAKTDPSVLFGWTADRLEELIKAPPSRLVERWLLHLPRITVDVVEILATPDLLSMATFSLLADEPVAGEPRLADALGAIRALREIGLAPPKPSRFRSHAEVFDLLESSISAERAFAGGFPAPAGELVLPGAPPIHLQPIETLRELAAQALAERSCLLSDLRYAKTASSGGGALWRASWDMGQQPLTCTVWARLDREGRWRLREARGPGGLAFDGDLWERVGGWIDSLNPMDEPMLVPQQPREVQLTLPLTRRSSPGETPTWVQAVSRLRALDQSAPMERP